MSSSQVAPALVQESNITPETARGKKRVFVLAADASKTQAVPGAASEEYEVLRVTSSATAPKGTESLESFLPADWESRLQEKFAFVAREWHKKLGKAAALLCFPEVDLALAGQYSFLSRVVHEKGRTLVAVDTALAALAPDEVYVDATLYVFVAAVFPGPVHLLPGNQAPAAMPSLSGLVGEAVLGLVYKLGFTSLVSHIFQWLRGARPVSGQPVFVGTEHGLKNLEPFFFAAGVPIQVFRPGGRLLKNWGLASPHITWRVTYMEALLGLRAHVRAFWRSLSALRRLFSALRQGIFVPAFDSGGRNYYAVFWPEFVRFLLVYTPGAIKHRYLANEIVRRWEPKKVFFDNPNSWDFSVMAEVFRSAGVPTVGYVNGLVQDVIPFRCGIDVMLVSGEYDRRLLQPCLGAERMITFGYVAPQVRRKCERTNILLISSPARDPGLGTEFVRLALKFISRHIDPAEYQDVVLKLHPYESRKGTRAVLREFTELKGKLRVSQSDLHLEIARARFAFAMHSTVLLDFLNAGVPFLLFDSITYPRGTFYGEIPKAIKFCNLAQLHQCFRHIVDNQYSFEELRKIYYGSGSIDTFEVLRDQLL